MIVVDLQSKLLVQSRQLLLYCDDSSIHKSLEQSLCILRYIFRTITGSKLDFLHFEDSSEIVSMLFAAAAASCLPLWQAIKPLGRTFHQSTVKCVRLLHIHKNNV